MAAPPLDRDPTPARRRYSTVVWCLAILVGAGLALVAVTTVRRGETDDDLLFRHHNAEGKRLSALSLERLDGKLTLNLEDLRGQVSLINLWGPWCSACYFELPHLKDLQQKFAEDATFKLITVSCGTNAESEDLAQLRIDTAHYLHEQQLQVPTFVDPGGRTRQAIVESAGLQSTGVTYPLNLVVDRDGIIRGLWMGFKPGVENDIAETIDSLL